ncbi:DUF2971 domain-containing protein [Pseudomonas fluorescens]|uniref:DUF2971 domain-containing protein n=1 Tax=Pseudomonas fluorescens TaxID=294 RepID=UPI0018AFDED5|nr:DUF2971 domain-containing protein [Pseudomonas fluorescens]
MNVYKYLDASRVSFLSDGLIRFSQPGALNDPYECLPALPEELVQQGVAAFKASVEREYAPLSGDDRTTRRLKAAQLKVAMRSAAKKTKDTSVFIRKMFFDKTNEKMNSGLGILSLSRRWNSALMWSHYTSSYAGFCVGFKKDHPFFEGVPDRSGHKFPLNPVRYSNERMIVHGRKFTPHESVAVVLTKSEDWKYEEEERLVSMLEVASEIKEMKPYNVHLFKVPLDCISELIVGQRADTSLKDKILTAAKHLRVPVYETKISDISFDVERRLLKTL